MPVELGTLDKLQIQVQWVAEWRRTPNWEIHGITSPYTIIWLIVEGRKTLRAGNQVYQLQAGELVILPPHISISVDKSTADEGTLQHLAIGFDWKVGALDFVKIYQFPYVTNVAGEASHDMLIRTWREVYAEFAGLPRDVVPRDAVQLRGAMPKQDAAAEKDMLFYHVDQAHRFIRYNAYLYQLMALFIQLLRPQLSSFPLPLDARVYEACIFIRAHMGEKVTARDIARHVYISEPHLRMLFRQALGMPPMEYVRQTRIERARELLSMTSCSLKEISEQLGFEDQSQLSRAFRKAEGSSPLAYRRQWQLL
jgi:AraC-like DNA-binding protein